MERIIEELGLTEAESKVYLALLRKGSCLVSEITKDTGLHRRTVYDVLYRLRAKGLVSNIILNNQRHFEAVDPERLLELLKEKEETFKKILPNLKELHNATRERKGVFFFKGKQALKTLFEDQLKAKKEIWGMTKVWPIEEIKKYYFFPRFHKRRAALGIKYKLILNEESKKLPEIKKIPLSEKKYLPNFTESNMSTFIYEDTVNLILWTSEPLSIIIREQEMADGFRNYFKILWQVAHK